jgi:DNA polymerase kappa
VLDDPSLKDKAFGVGGPSNQSGVLSTASYAARAYGVRSGMATYIAKKLCPQLIVIKSHFDRYNSISNQVMGILRNFDPDMDPAGVDEAYLK